MALAVQEGIDMATTRRRTARQQGSAVPPEIRALFDVGCGWNSYADDEVSRLWAEHGESYLRNHRSKEPCFAELILGAPSEQEENQ